MNFNELRIHAARELDRATKLSTLVDDVSAVVSVAEALRKRVGESDPNAFHEFDKLGPVLVRHADVQLAICGRLAAALDDAAASLLKSVGAAAGEIANTSATPSEQATKQSVASPPAEKKKIEDPEAAVGWCLTAIENQLDANEIHAIVEKARRRHAERFFSDEQFGRITTAANGRLEAIPKPPMKAETF